MFILNESYISRLFDTQSIEILSLMIFANISIFICTNNNIAIALFLINYLFIAPIFWTTAKVAVFSQNHSSLNFDKDNDFAKIMNYFCFAKTKFESLSKKLKSSKFINLDSFIKSYKKFLNQIPNYKSEKNKIFY